LFLQKDEYFCRNLNNLKQTEMNKNLLVAVTCLLGVALVQPQHVFAKGIKQKKVVKLKAQKGANAGMAGSKPTGDTKKEKARGSYCSVYFNNFTGYYVDVYMDGVYWGEIAPYGGGTVTDGDGYTRIYCQTVGGSYSWTASGNCDHDYEYDLTESDSN
jgi:hypothetical protein